MHGFGWVTLYIPPISGLAPTYPSSNIPSSSTVIHKAIMSNLLVRASTFDAAQIHAALDLPGVVVIQCHVHQVLRDVNIDNK